MLTEEKYHKTRARMQHLQATTRDGSAAAALAQLTDETAANRQRLHTTLPAEIRRKQLRLNTLQKVRERSFGGGAKYQAARKKLVCSLSLLSSLSLARF